MTARPIATTLVVATFALLLVGGTVNPTGSSLACPDWPLCYGSAFPEMVGGVQFEHSHRLAATAVGLLSILLALVAWRSRDLPARARRLAAFLVPLVALQGLLGGITVIYRLPTLVSTAHLALSMGFFLLTMTLAWWLHAPAVPGAAAPRALAAVALGLTWAQIVLGGLVRHVGAGRACGVEVPFCAGDPWPASWVARLHMSHRYAGAALAVFAVAAGLALARRAHRARRPLARLAALAAPVLALVQVGLGVATVTTGIAFAPIMAHFAVAILLLAAWHACLMSLGPSGARREALAPAAAAARALA